MDNLINKIIDIDQNARLKLEKAYEQKKSILLDGEKQEEQIKSKVCIKIDDRVIKVEAFEKKEADEKIEKISIKTEDTIKELNDIFENNHEKWENDIFMNIINQK